MGQKPTVPMIFSPLVFTLPSNLHQLQNVIGWADFCFLHEIAPLGPAIGFGFVSDSLSFEKFGDLSHDVPSVAL